MCMHMCVHIWVCLMPQPHSWFWQMKPSFWYLMLVAVSDSDGPRSLLNECLPSAQNSFLKVLLLWHLIDVTYEKGGRVAFPGHQVTKLECPTGKFPNSPRRCWMLSVRSWNAGSGFVWHLLLLSSLWWLQWEVSRTDLGIWTPAPKLMAIFGRFGRCGFVGVSHWMQALRV